MAEIKEPSFGLLVFGRAISSTKKFFGSTARDLVIGAISLAVGFGLYWYFKGLPIAMEETASVVAFTLAPAGFVLVVVFAWNLWLAPAAIAYEAAKEAHTAASKAISAGAQPIAARPAAPPVVKGSHVNWQPWAIRSKITVSDLAKILAKEDPAAPGHSTEYFGFLELILEQMRENKLLPDEPLERDYYTRAFKKPDSVTVLNKADAIKWAKKNKFHVEHIE